MSPNRTSPAPRAAPGTRPGRATCPCATRAPGRRTTSFTRRTPPRWPTWRAACGATSRHGPRPGMAHRARVLRQWCDVVTSVQAEIVAALSTDTGRYALVFSELRVLRGLVEGYAAMGSQLLVPRPSGPSVAPDIGIETQLVPYGLVGVISPWNFPFLLSMLDAIPALHGRLRRHRQAERGHAALHPAAHGCHRAGAGTGWRARLRRRRRSHRRGAHRAVGHPLLHRAACATGRKVAEACARRFITVLPGTRRQGSGYRAGLRRSGARRRGGTARLGAGDGPGLPVHRAGLRGSPDSRPLSQGVWSDRANRVELNYPDIHRGQIGPLIFARQAEIIADASWPMRAPGARRC